MILSHYSIDDNKQDIVNLLQNSFSDQEFLSFFAHVTHSTDFGVPTLKKLVDNTPGLHFLFFSELLNRCVTTTENNKYKSIKLPK